MNRPLLSASACLALAASAPFAHATTADFNFSGPGTSGSLALTYGTTTDARYPQGFLVTGASGTFSDTHLGLSDVAITGEQPLNLYPPEPTNGYAPADFSHYVASGLLHGFISYDNLVYPGGSPRSSTDYPFSGGPFDIYGVLLTLSNNDVLNVWSNGLLPNAPAVDYGIAVLNSTSALDYVSTGVAPTPEPGTLALLGTGLLGAWGTLARRRRR